MQLSIASANQTQLRLSTLNGRKKEKSSGVHRLRFENDTITLLETNVDDVTGEILGNTIEILLNEGALDASAIPFIGKKGRPGFTVRVTCYPRTAKKLAEILVKETGSFGVKITKVERLKVPRKEVNSRIKIDGKDYSVRLKVANHNLGMKPEFEDVKVISKQTGLTVRRVLDIINEKVNRNRFHLE